MTQAPANCGLPPQLAGAFVSTALTFNANILSREVQQFIADHNNDDVVKLLLKGGEVGGVPMKAVTEQISARRKLNEKLSEWTTTTGIYYPPALSVEQASSTLTAGYKTKYLSGKVLFDLTGGLGADTLAFSTVYEKVYYVEQDPELCETARHNFSRFSRTNIEVVCNNAENFSDELPDGSDVFIDPSRRDEVGGKVFRLEDCRPDTGPLAERLIAKNCRILLKVSPLLDIRQALRQLPYAIKVIVLAVKNECKELLFLMGPGGESPEITAVNLTGKEEDIFKFTNEDEAGSEVEISLPKKYIYLPNNAILKAGAFRLVGQRFGLKKLHINTHLYTSDQKQEYFPGRVFLLKDVLKVDKREVRKALPEGQANVLTRNFPLPAPALRDRLSLRDGGDDYICGVTLQDGKRRLLWLKK